MTGVDSSTRERGSVQQTGQWAVGPLQYIAATHGGSGGWVFFYTPPHLIGWWVAGIIRYTVAMWAAGLL